RERSIFHGGSENSLGETNLDSRVIILLLTEGGSLGDILTRFEFHREMSFTVPRVQDQLDGIGNVRRQDARDHRLELDRQGLVFRLDRWREQYDLGLFKKPADMTDWDRHVDSRPFDPAYNHAHDLIVAGHHGASRVARIERTIHLDSVQCTLLITT